MGNNLMEFKKNIKQPPLTGVMKYDTISQTYYFCGEISQN